MSSLGLPNAGTRRSQLLIAGGAITGVLTLVMGGMWLFDGSRERPRRAPTTVSITAPGTVEDKDAWRAQQAASEQVNSNRIDDVATQLRAQEESSKRLADALEELKRGAQAEQRVGGAGGGLPDLQTATAGGSSAGYTTTNDAASGFVPEANGNGPVSGISMLNEPLDQMVPTPREIEVITFDAAPANQGQGSLAPVPPSSGANADVSSEPVNFMPAGSFVRVAMLNGVDAPTGGQAQSNPLPVAFHVIDVASLANRHKLDIKDCRFIAAAWGDLSSERMMGRTETLTCIINGQTIEMPVKGQVIGEDGKAGVRGRLVTKQGQLLANALFSGTLSGIGQAIQQSSSLVTSGAGGVTQIIDPSKAAQAGIGGGLSGASNLLAQYYLKAADKLFPIIETDGGRTVEILITKGAIYEDKGGGKSHAAKAYRQLLRRHGARRRRYRDEDE